MAAAPSLPCAPPAPSSSSSCSRFSIAAAAAAAAAASKLSALPFAPSELRGLPRSAAHRHGPATFSPTAASPSWPAKARRAGQGPVSGARPRSGGPEDGPSSPGETEELSFFDGRVAPVLSAVTPLAAVKWAAIGAIAVAALRMASGVASRPGFWLYGSWFFVVWPWPVAVSMGVWALVAAYRQRERRAREWEQVLILGGALLWLILVPLGHINGYIDGWPLALFFVYFYFFLISAFVRLRLYGELTPLAEDKQWASTPSRMARVSFIIAVVAGHWLAAYEAPFLFFTWRWGWPSVMASAVLILAMTVHYNATYYLGKYFDRLVKPLTVVTFGPYRWVRHPIYTSYMLLFAGYCLALRAYWSMAFLLLACLLYYEQRVELEESMLVETFPELYGSYKDKVTKKYFPFLY